MWRPGGFYDIDGYCRFILAGSIVPFLPSNVCIIFSILSGIDSISMYIKGMRSVAGGL